MPDETHTKLDPHSDSPDTIFTGPAHSAPEAGTETRENLQGCIPTLATAEEVRSALEQAFDYRGDVTITRKNGVIVEGYIFDRRSVGPSLEECSIRMLPRNGPDKIEIRFSDIARLEFTGKDTAAGKSFEAWLAQYRKKKANGERNIFLAPDSPD